MANDWNSVAWRPVPSFSHCVREGAKDGEAWNAMREEKWPDFMRAVMNITAWSDREVPMPGRGEMMGMECFWSSEGGPMPERRRSLGVSKEPAVRITSLVAWARESQGGI